MGTNYGYIRVSSKYQNVARQVYQMQQNGIAHNRIYIDKQSGKDFERTSYKKLIRKIKQDDTIFVGSISRFGRNYMEITEQWRYLTHIKKVNIVVLDMPLLDTRPQKDLLGKFIGDLVLYILSYVAESERQNIKKSQAEGIMRAKERGVKFGRPNIITVEEFAERYAEYRNDGFEINEMVKKLQMSTATFYRYRSRIESGRIDS